jgi:hypothetical protein
LGGLEDAIARAADRAKLGDDYAVLYLEREARGLERYLSLLVGSITTRFRTELNAQMGWVGKILGAASGELDRDMAWTGKSDRIPSTSFRTASAGSGDQRSVRTAETQRISRE